LGSAKAAASDGETALPRRNLDAAGGKRFSAAMQLSRLGELARFWYLQRVRGFSPPGAPELDGETLDRLTQELRRCTSYLEFGSGGSTLLADRLGVRTVTIESDRFYARTVASALTGDTVTIVPVDVGITAEWGWPVFKRPTDSRIGRWRRYVSSGFDRTSPDLVLVDGRFRVACALETARRTDGAVLIVDDYLGRQGYRTLERYLGAPERVGRAAVFRTNKQPIPDDVVSNAIRDPS
jgi:hypothetical protein